MTVVKARKAAILLIVQLAKYFFGVTLDDYKYNTHSTPIGEDLLGESTPLEGVNIAD
jgi:hypothetical protein